MEILKFIGMFIFTVINVYLIFILILLLIYYIENRELPP